MASAVSAPVMRLLPIPAASRVCLNKKPPRNSSVYKKSDVQNRPDVRDELQYVRGQSTPADALPSEADVNLWRESAESLKIRGGFGR